jgi:hypothetical protein
MSTPSGKPSRPSQAANDGPPEEAAVEHRDNIIDHRDLVDLEASLRCLQLRQAAAMRLPRAPNLSPPRSRPPPSATLGGAHSRERMVDAFRSPPSLEPTRLSPPPTKSDRNPHALLGVSIACFLVAAIVYYYLVAGRSPSSQPMPKSQIASVARQPSTSAIQPEPAAQPVPQPSSVPDDDREISADAAKLFQPIGTSQATSTSQRETVAMLQPAADGAGAPASRKAVRAPQEIELLMKKGEQFIAAGDVVTARIAFQRAAEAGDATAALALAATYDPTILAKLGVMGMGADVEQARIWYRMAESYGSTEATQRLQLLDKH